jgi:hypothetical protein
MWLSIRGLHRISLLVRCECIGYGDCMPIHSCLAREFKCGGKDVLTRVEECSKSNLDYSPVEDVADEVRSARPYRLNLAKFMNRSG